MYFDLKTQALVGKHGASAVTDRDEVTLKLAILIEGECEGLGPIQAARKYGFSKGRYFQLRQAYQEQGAQSLKCKRRDPKGNYRRTGDLVRQVIRHRFLDPDASAEVILLGQTPSSKGSLARQSAACCSVPPFRC